MDRRAKLLGALVFATYVLVSFRIGEVFPFARFRMFSRTVDQASRLVARTADGRIHEIAEFEGWTCDAVAKLDESCGIGYPDAEERVRAELKRRGRPSTSGAPEVVEVVRQQFVAPDPEGPMVTRQCAVLVCRAVRAQ